MKVAVKLSNFKRKNRKLELKHEENDKVKIRIRLIPIWLRVIMIIALIFVSMTLGAAIGYGVLGDGKVKRRFQTINMDTSYRLSPS